eukprot:CAMPEP_0201901438 /NCGR_PEP_ID=MMETSP0902-20130614/54273_1 /ASSEMBLY_ACC=CAM_ASM_000551 /TAXON_ID=420261 /ORGANISM="Thalassiosira antarctica, Strain CCMP982" /LENGTH=699 /DNA_ID=CAMNT_0048435369 /DNA_START=73 /DNA_END=2172 /DNA_ORIENTATION=-
MDSSDDNYGRPHSPPRESSRQQPTPRTTRFSIKKAASEVFSRGKRRQDKSDDGLNSSFNSQLKPQLSTSDLASSFQSQASHDSGEKRGDVDHDVASPPLPFHVIGFRMRMAFNRTRQDGNAAELKSNRRRSRRTRNSDPNVQMLLSSIAGEDDSEVQRGAVGGKSPMGYIQLRSAHLMPNPLTCDSCKADDSLTTKLLESTGKNNFCDIEITGKDNVAVKAPSFLLACHSAVFEEIFYPKDESKATYSIISQCDPRKVNIAFAAQSTIEAAIHFCATLELPPHLENQTNEASIRTISQLHLFAKLFKVLPLLNAAYRTARRLMNKDPSLVCAAFDECNVMLANAESENNWGMTMGKQNYDDLKAYALDYLRESPMDTIMGPGEGVMFLSSASIKAIVSDQEMDVDEYSMWRILNLWVKKAPGIEDAKIACARSLVSHIQLVFIDPIQLNYQIKKCGFVDPSDVEKALKEIELMLENESPDDKERVIVEGAGDDRVNGVYVLADEDIGLKTDEVMFLKEGEEDEDFSTDFGLYRWGETWGISNCTDYFNLLYSCEVSRHKGHSHRKPPKWGWKCEGGQEKAPTCTWKPSKEEENMDVTKLGIAPALSELKKEKKKAIRMSVMNARSHNGHALTSSFTLSQMMSLPEDEDYSKEDHKYASLTKDLDTMMNLSVDEGHDDEEAGYNLNYMSGNLKNTVTKPS